MDARVEYLLSQCVELAAVNKALGEHIEELAESRDELAEYACSETGMEDTSSVLQDVMGFEPQHRETIRNLARHLERQDRWLKSRLEEVTVLQNAIVERKVKAAFYRDKAAKSMKDAAVLFASGCDWFGEEEWEKFVRLHKDEQGE